MIARLIGRTYASLRSYKSQLVRGFRSRVFIFCYLFLSVKMSAAIFTNICFKSEKMIVKCSVWFLILFATARTFNHLNYPQHLAYPN